MKKITPFIPLIIIVLLFAALGGKLAIEKDIRSDDTKQSPIIGQKIPEFKLPSLYDDSPFTNKDISGKKVLLNVFGSWCAACVAEHKFLMELSAEDFIPIYGINWKDSDEAAKNYLKKLGNPYKKVGIDKDSAFAIALGVSGAPETFLINENGEIISHFSGVLTEKIFNEKFLTKIK